MLRCLFCLICISLILFFGFYWNFFCYRLCWYFICYRLYWYFICFRLYSRLWIFFLFSCCRFVNWPWIRRVAVWRVYFRFPTSHELKSRFFCARINFVVYSELHTLHCLFKLVVVSNRAFCVYQHSSWHKPCSRTHGKV